MGDGVMALLLAVVTGRWIKVARIVLRKPQLLWVALLPLVIPGVLVLIVVIAATSALQMLTGAAGQPIEPMTPPDRAQMQHLATAWEGHLTANERQQILNTETGISVGLLWAFKELGAQDMPKLVAELTPQSVKFTVYNTTVKTTVVKQVLDVKGHPHPVTIPAIHTIHSKPLLTSIHSYNGDYTFRWAYTGGANGTWTMVSRHYQPDYARLYKAEANQNLGLMPNLEDQTILFKQALLVDPNFYDPDITAVLGGASDTGNWQGNGGSKVGMSPYPLSRVTLKNLEAAQTQSLPPLAWPMPNGRITEAQLRFQTVDAAQLLNFINVHFVEPAYGCDSIFTVQDVQEVIDAAKSADVNPVLLMAFTGAEQSFVPANTESAELIANNPFNVYGSWQQYNTTLANSASIAANTIRYKLASPTPDGEDAIEWINDPRNPDYGAYAQAGETESRNVEAFFVELEQGLGFRP